MLSASLFDSAKRILCIGAHPDDIEIGCGATLLAIREASPAVDIRFSVMTGPEERVVEAKTSAELFLGDQSKLTIHGFRDGFLPYDDPALVKDALIEAGDAYEPDIVIAPRPDDAHQDHRLLGTLVWQIFRDHVILAYELPKYESDMGDVNAFVSFGGRLAHTKVDYLMEAFVSQLSRTWFDRDVFLGSMSLRAVQAGGASEYAEGFLASKILLS